MASVAAEGMKTVVPTNFSTLKYVFILQFFFSFWGEFKGKIKVLQLQHP